MELASKIIDSVSLLVIEHNVGVAPAKTYTLKPLDKYYFENL